MTQRNNKGRDKSLEVFAETISAADKRHIEKAVRAAQHSQHKYKVGAALVVAGRITAQSNRLRNSHIVAPFTEQSVHAEVRAILRGYKNGRGGTMYVARLGKLGRLLPSHPCWRCSLVLSEAGVKRVVWWNGSSWAAKKI